MSTDSAANPFAAFTDEQIASIAGDVDVAYWEGVGGGGNRAVDDEVSCLLVADLARRGMERPSWADRLDR